MQKYMYRKAELFKMLYYLRQKRIFSSFGA